MVFYLLNDDQDTSEVVEKGKKQKRNKGGSGNKDEEIKKNNVDKNKEENEGAPSGYIHVRARRGQATDSHSLAERVYLFTFYHL